MGMLPLQISAKSIGGGVRGETKRRWAMVADIETCTDCMKELKKKTGNEEVKPPCVIACDRENNVPDFEEKEIDPQWMRIARFKNKFGDEFYVPLLCNHCENPPCAQVCLTQATFKRSDGIVEVDMHRCIGCRYCMIACPFGGLIVDPLTMVILKCDLCDGDPQCAKFCPREAIAYLPANRINYLKKKAGAEKLSELFEILVYRRAK